jgi:hypothetical protein
LEGADLARLDVVVSHDGFGPVIMTTLGSWMVWRLLEARQSSVARGAVFSLMGALGLMMGALGLTNCWCWPGSLMGAIVGSM